MAKTLHRTNAITLITNYELDAEYNHESAQERHDFLLKHIEENFHSLEQFIQFCYAKKSMKALQDCVNELEDLGIVDEDEQAQLYLDESSLRGLPCIENGKMVWHLPDDVLDKPVDFSDEIPRASQRNKKC